MSHRPRFSRNPILWRVRVTTTVEVVIRGSAVGIGTGPGSGPVPRRSAERLDVGDHLRPRGVDGLLPAFDPSKTVLNRLHDGGVLHALVRRDRHGLGAVGEDLADR